MKLEHEVLGLDFDGTVVGEDFPRIGKLRDGAHRVLHKYKRAGGTIILWTCREGPTLVDAVRFCLANDIPIDYVNENIPGRIAKYSNDPRKIGCDLFFDDKTIGGADWDALEKYLGLD